MLKSVRRTCPQWGSCSPPLPPAAAAGAYIQLWPKQRPAVHACMLQLLTAFQAAGQPLPQRLLVVMLGHTRRQFGGDEARAGPVVMLEGQASGVFVVCVCGGGGGGEAGGRQWLSDGKGCV
jgi:hypothetical protein